MTAPGGVELTPVQSGTAVVRCCERREDGKTVGELEVSMFSAALIIDRDGILEEKAREVAAHSAHAVRIAGTVAVSLPGASGYRADVEPVRTALPYVHVFAMAPHDLGVDGGIVVTVRSAQPDWPAAEQILSSLRFLTRHGTARPANDETELHEPMLPVVPK
ncbi:MAG: hypothetical protein IPQ07_14275 [Myxococcales bacterium]|nr:hypothetical protein [Myxococcales bacterium]